MAFVTVKEASAGGAVVGTNLMAGHRLQIVPKMRRVTRIGVAGGAAVADGAVDLFYGDTYIGTFYNTTAAAAIPVDGKDMMNVTSQYVLEANEPLNVLVSDQFGGTNIAYVSMEIQEF